MLVDEESPPPEAEEPEEKTSAVKRHPLKIENFLLQREYASVKRPSKIFDVNFQSNHFCQKDVREHTGCVNALQFSHGEQFLASGGDDQYPRFWAVDELMLRKAPQPKAIMVEGHRSNIFSLEFDLTDKFLYSGERWGTIIKHDIETRQSVYTSNENNNSGDVFHLDQHPFDNNTIAVTRAKMVSFIDDRDRPNPVTLIVASNAGKDFYTAQFHPEAPCLLLVNSEGDGPNVFDRRNPVRPVFQRSIFDGLPRGPSAWMGSMWSPSGDQFIAIRRSMCPLYFDIISKRCFTLKSAESPIGYRNVKTIKSMTFIDDYTVATGSDHWGIHIWKVPRADDSCGFTQIDHPEEEIPTELIVEKEMQVLRGHRSVPNQVRFSKHNQLLVSSGVENSFKLWLDRRLPWSYDIPFQRKKRGSYDHSQEEECLREMEERRILEDALDREGEMEGRAEWRDVFSGNAQTAEHRDTLEMFDVMDGDREQSSSSDSGDEELFIPFRLRRQRERRGARLLNDLLLDDEDDVIGDEDGRGPDIFIRFMNMRRRPLRRERQEPEAALENGNDSDDDENVIAIDEDDNQSNASADGEGSDTSEDSDPEDDMDLDVEVENDNEESDNEENDNEENDGEGSGSDSDDY